MADTKAKGTARHAPRNRVLANSGVMQYSRSKMYDRKGMHKLHKKGEPIKGSPLKVVKRGPRVVKKSVNGAKNGGYRIVRKNKMPRSYPTEERPRKLRSHKKPFSQHKHTLKTGLVPGTVLILLAGRHKGKRVIFLKQLNSGLLLVTGPMKLNQCPMRRINQIYTIATSTRIDMSEVKVPAKLNDEYFRRKKLNKSRHREGDIFDTKKETYKVTDERKTDQKEMDKQITAAIRKHSDKKLLFKYLVTMFRLQAKQYPHQMKF